MGLALSLIDEDASAAGRSRTAIVACAASLSGMRRLQVWLIQSRRTDSGISCSPG